MSKTIYTKDPAKRFYVYAFLREDRTPYYIGKGVGNRAWKKRRRNSPPADSSRIIILKETLTESEALTEEIRLIHFYGRKDLGTGILRNLTDGGEGTSGCIASPETLAKRSAAMSGENNPNFGKCGEKSPNFGKHHTQNTLDKMSAVKSGENNPMYGKQSPNFGKHPSQETRDKQSAAKSGENNPNFGKKRSPETLAKISATRKRNKEAKIVLSLLEEEV